MFCFRASAVAAMVVACMFPIPAAAQQGPEMQAVSPLDRDRPDRSDPVSQPEVPPADTQAPGPPVAVEIAAEENAPPIRSIDFAGASVPQVVAEAAYAFVGQRPTGSNIQALAEAMTEAYKRSDVALFTLAIPQQDLSDGKLTVRVAEGHIEAVILTGETEGRSHPLVVNYAEKLRSEKPLSRRTMERYISLMRDIPGLSVKSRMDLGRTPGGVRLILDLDYSKTKLTFSYDSRSTRLISGGQAEAKLEVPRLLRDGDQTIITAAASPNLSGLLFAGISHSTPLGGEGARLSLSFGHLETKPQDSMIEGAADSASLSVSYPFIRSYRSRLDLGFSADLIDSDNSALGSLIASEKVRALRASLGYNDRKAKQVIGGRLTLSQGIDALGASVLPSRGKASFRKVTGAASYNRQIGEEFFARLNVSGQYADDALPVSERFSVGGSRIGRAFERGLISADRGLGASLELAARPLSGDFSRSEIYGFGDYAIAGFRPRPGTPAQTFDLASLGAGLRATWTEKVTVGVEGARVIDRPFATYEGNWRVTFYWALQFRP